MAAERSPLVSALRSGRYVNCASDVIKVAENLLIKPAESSLVLTTVRFSEPDTVTSAARTAVFQNTDTRTCSYISRERN